MTWSEFFHMGGYAYYVWGSYLATLIIIGGEVFSLVRRKRKLATQPGRASTLPRGRAK